MKPPPKSHDTHHAHKARARSGSPDYISADAAAKEAVNPSRAKHSVHHNRDDRERDYRDSRDHTRNHKKDHDPRDRSRSRSIERHERNKSAHEEFAQIEARTAAAAAAAKDRPKPHTAKQHEQRHRSVGPAFQQHKQGDAPLPSPAQIIKPPAQPNTTNTFKPKNGP